MGGINPNRSLDRSNVLFLTKVKLFGYLAHFCQRLAPRLCKSKSNTQDMSGQSTQSLMTDLGLRAWSARMKGQNWEGCTTVRVGWLCLQRMNLGRFRHRTAINSQKTFLGNCSVL